jgi:hypothetical protein
MRATFNTVVLPEAPGCTHVVGCQRLRTVVAHALS